MYIPLGITNGNETLIEERMAIWKANPVYFTQWLPAAWFGFFFDIFVLATFFIFKKQRKFPHNLIGLFCAVDAIHFLRELIKASPIEYINEEFYWSPTPAACATVWLWISWVEAAQYVLALSLSFIIYVSIVRKQPITYKHNRTYAFGTLIIGIVYPILYTILQGIVVSSVGFKIVGVSCAPGNNAPSIIGIVQCFIVITVLIIFIGMSLRYPYIWQVLRSVNDVSEYRNNRKVWITIRFIAIIILQALPRVAYNIYYLSLVINIGSPKTQVSNFSTYSILVGYFGNCIVVFWSNRGLQRWIKQKLDAGGITSSSTPDEEESKKNELKSYTKSTNGEDTESDKQRYNV